MRYFKRSSPVTKNLFMDFMYNHFPIIVPSLGLIWTEIGHNSISDFLSQTYIDYDAIAIIYQNYPLFSTTSVVPSLRMF